jgi:hypothetical protein
LRRATQSFYSLGELARLSGVSARRVSKLLESNGVRFVRVGAPLGRAGRSGQKRVVFLSELERAMPDLVDSVRFTGGSGREDIPTDDD